MQRAGAAAAAEIARRSPTALRRGVAIYTGAGNNGGDGWVVAGAMAAAGVRTRVREVAEPRTDDARAERRTALQLVDRGTPHGGEEIIVDALLGTGTAGSPRGEIADAIREIADRREHGASVVSLDVPSGLDATSGRADGSVAADLTLTFGTMKRGLLISRGHSGRIVVLDIGLGALLGRSDDEAAEPDRPTRRTAAEPRLVDAAWARAQAPPIAPEAHKGTRRKLAVVGGGPGMLGAAVLAARAAMASGIGMVRLVVDRSNLASAQTAAYEALAVGWPEDDESADESINRWADGVLLGPGLGREPWGREIAERVLRVWRGPVVVDADALNAFDGDVAKLRDLLGGRTALLTPHVGEFARLAGCATEDVLASRFEIGGSLARNLGCVLLLKGVPTVVSAPDGRSLVSASGTPALAMAGSGDLLGGIAATLLTQDDDALVAGAAAAAVHGRAGELANRRRSVRGVTLDDVVRAVPRVWAEREIPARPPVLAELPPVGDRLP